MKIIMDYKVNAKLGFVYMDLEILRDCKEIQGFLENPNMYHDTLQKRIKDYLKEQKIYDNDWNLTPKGEKIKQEGKRFVKECGKYKILFLQNDKFFSNRILSFERIAVNDKKDIYTESIAFKQGVQAYEKAKQLVTIKPYKECKIEILSQNHSQTFRYVRIYDIDLKTDSIIQDNEVITINNERIPNATEHFLAIEYFMPYYIQALNEWDNDKKMLRLTTEDLESKDITRQLRTFKLESLQKEVFTFQQIPIYPKDTECAKLWLESCLSQDLEDSYLTNNEFMEKYHTYLHETPLRYFQESYDTKEEIKKKLQENLKKENPKAFWHSIATDDLLPQNTKTSKTQHSESSITLANNEQLSLQDLANRLKQQDLLQGVIYIDRYIKTSVQQQRINCFIESFSPEFHNAHIITHNNSQDSINPNIQLHCFKDICKNGNSPHDRYLILQYADSLQIWKISQSDFLYLKQDENITKDTTGEARGATFTLLEDFKCLNKDMQEYITNLLENAKGN